jgi:microcystin-dependent protein
VSSVVVVDQTEGSILESYLTLAALGGGLAVRLFTNDVTAGLTPAQRDALDDTDFTEATFAGYAAVVVDAVADWTITLGDPTNMATDVPATFTRSSTGTAQDVYGYYVTAEADDTLQWFEQFDAPVTIEVEDDAINVTPTLTLDDTEGHQVQTGTITMWAAATAPQGWVLCDGTARSRSTFADLFAVIGTTYGVGDGSTTFNVPNLEQRFPLGKADSGTGANLGDTGGSIDHVHDLDTSSSFAAIFTAANLVRMARRTGLSYNSSHDFTPTSGLAASVVASTVGAQLQGDTDTENPPFLTVNFIIKT